MGFFKNICTPESKEESAPEQKQILGYFDTTTDLNEWYERNGYNFELLGSYSSHAGVTVSEAKALEVGAFYAGVKLIAEDMGSLPLFLYERSEKEGLRKATEHSLWPVLRGLVNPFISTGEFVEALTAHGLLGLDGYAWIERWNGGKKIYLHPWQPTEVRLDKDRAGRPVYIRKEGNSAEKAFQSEEVFHLKGFSFDAQTGDKIVSRARQLLGLSLAMQTFAGKWFKNDVSAGIFLEHPAKLGPEGILGVKAGYRNNQGLDHVGEPFVLAEGMTAKRLDPDMEKMQLIESRKEGVKEVARILRLPLYKLAELDRAIQSNIEQQARDYVQLSLSPWIRRWRDAVYRCLLTRDEQMAGRLYAEHSAEAIQRGDFKTQTEGFRSLLEKGVYSINEVRRWFNLNPVEGGDEHRVQLNTTAISETAKALIAEIMLEVKRGNVVDVQPSGLLEAVREN